MGSLRFVPAQGEWTVLAAWPIMAALPSELPAAVLDAVWAAMQAEGASLESVVSSIPLRGATEAASFSVVSFDSSGPRTVLAVVRGSAAIDVLSVGGSRRFGSQGAEPWALAQFVDVIGVTAGTLPPVPESALRLPAGADRLVTGIVRASRVVWADSSDDFLPECDAAPVSPLRNDAASDRAGDPDDDTIVSARTLDTPPPGREEPAAESPAAQSPAAERPAAERPAAEQPPSGPAAFELRVGDGPARPLDHPVVIGRRPRPRQSYSGEQAVLVEVASPTSAVSANHVEIAPVGSTAVVTDLRSSNGTRVSEEGARVTRLRQGDSVVVTGSAIVEIGDGNVIHISSRDRGTSGITV
ncbi:MAG: FHA domain-containing protein [Herbiconiux sp.]|uniref:FHA domain-containing protein n=1 Tax=Herbiconiux sp. TaxID=1871186 RepID=UPI0011F6E245|nr:FHA domain-containing protein [Herbiconiux sp.]TAJ46755.1 MAG: FHA domain-containing protein [Herbiconiux sp.]